MFFCEFCEIFKNTYFAEHIWTIASVFTKHFRATAPGAIFEQISGDCNLTKIKVKK